MKKSETMTTIRLSQEDIKTIAGSLYSTLERARDGLEKVRGTEVEDRAETRVNRVNDLYLRISAQIKED